VQELRTNVLDPGGKLVALGTKWHRDDCWNLLPPARKYTIYDVGTLTPEQIAEKKKTINPLLWACNYELDIISDENAIFQDMNIGKWQFDKVKNVQASLDTAFDGDHYNALSIAGSLGDGKINAVGFTFAGNVKDWLPDIVRKLVRYGVKKIHIEANADKSYTADLIKLSPDVQKHHIWVHSYDEKMNKHLKICTYAAEAWKDTEWAEETDDEYRTQFAFYAEKALPDDAPDGYSALIRESGLSVTKQFANRFLAAWSW